MTAALSLASIGDIYALGKAGSDDSRYLYIFRRMERLDWAATLYQLAGQVYGGAWSGELPQHYAHALGSADGGLDSDDRAGVAALFLAQRYFIEGIVLSGLKGYRAAKMLLRNILAGNADAQSGYPRGVPLRFPRNLLTVMK